MNKLIPPTSWLVGCLLIPCLPGTQARAVTFTSDTTISASNTVYEGDDVVVTNCTLTLSGGHAFASVQVLSGGVITHLSSATSFLYPINLTNEPLVLTGTNPVTFAMIPTNFLAGTEVVTHAGGTIIYSNGPDYLIATVSTNGATQLQRTPSSAIPDGATVLVSFQASVFVPGGLGLTTTGNIEIAPGGSINVNGKGYAGNQGYGSGLEAGNPAVGGGGGYGGVGGIGSTNALGGVTYGSFEQPTDLGSGGGASYAGVGGAGGGEVGITAGGTITINGSISANGYDATKSRSGGGSGGSVWITAPLVTGSGSISANGGAGEPADGGGGGGGRISIQTSQDNLSGLVTTYGGPGFVAGGAGTVFTKIAAQNGLLTIDNGSRSGTNTTVAVTDSVDVMIRGMAVATPLSTWNVGNLTLASNGFMTTFMPGKGTILTVNASGNATIRSGGSISLDLAGSPGGQGTGAGRGYQLADYWPGGGGAYGGNGASGSDFRAYGGISFGSETQPIDVGSGGGSLATSIGGSGGGAVRLIVNGILQVDGSLSANGGDGSGTGGGGGSGGSVWLSCGAFVGAGHITANGGNGVGAIGGGGGGGRIAIYPTTDLFAGIVAATGGGGVNWGGAGTVFIEPGGQNTQLILDNAGHAGTNTPLLSASSANLIIQNGAIGSVPNGASFANLIVATNAFLMPITLPNQPGTAFMTTISGNAVIQAGGGIVADLAGYPAGQGPGQGHLGQAAPVYPCSGAGHGGYGANGAGNYALGGTAYDTLSSPSSPGSGGGTYSQTVGTGYSFGGSGGGAIRLIVNGTLQVDGRLSGNAGNGSGPGGGGGSGGSIWLTVGTLSGSGIIAANGGSGSDSFGGGGGGGRISITYKNNVFGGLLTAHGGGGAEWGGAGTIYLKSNTQTYGQLILDNGGNIGTNTFMVSAPIADLTISGGAMGQLPGVTINNLVIKADGFLTASASSSEQAVTVMSNATIEVGGAISFDGRGFPPGQGPGAGNSSSPVSKGGGGHGGLGAGNVVAQAGGAYDSIQSSSMAGSGGGSGSGSTQLAPLGGMGGGAAKITVSGVLTVNGNISANGMDGDVNSGGGSGGSLWINAGTLLGSGVISANGGSGEWHRWRWRWRTDFDQCQRKQFLRPDLGLRRQWEWPWRRRNGLYLPASILGGGTIAG